jgi:hypothetical protein
VDKLVQYRAVPQADISSAARHLADCDAYALIDGALQPNPAAVKQLREAGFSIAFIRGVAKEAAERIENPAQRTLALYSFQGSSFDEEMADGEKRANGYVGVDPEDIATNLRLVRESGAPLPRVR